MRKYILIGIIVLLSFSSASCMRQYAYQNPFWFYQPEYYLTPETIELADEKVDNSEPSTPIDLSGFKARLPGNWQFGEKDLNNFFEVFNGESKFVLWVEPNKEEDRFDCNQTPDLIPGKIISGPNEPCTAPKDLREHYHKLFFLTLEDYKDLKITKANYYDFLIISQKVSKFRETKRLLYYKTDELEAYAEQLSFERNLIKIFPLDSGQAFTLHTENVDDETIEYFLSTLRVNSP